MKAPPFKLPLQYTDYPAPCLKDADGKIIVRVHKEDAAYLVQAVNTRGELVDLLKRAIGILHAGPVWTDFA